MGQLGEPEGITVRFEACTEFRDSHDDALICSCGWLEDDHLHEGPAMAVVAPVRRRRPQISLPERRAS